MTSPALNELYDLNWKDPEYSPIIAMRAKRLMRMKRFGNGYVIKLKVFYITHPIEFIQDWMWTYDPRVKPVWRPFILFPRQREYIQFLTEQVNAGEDGLVEKSRDVGVTWLNMAFAIHRWLLCETKIGFGSRKEANVDRLGDPDSIFEKGRMILRTLPHEFYPYGYSEEEHLCHMKFINPENNSTITGEAGDNIGRGGRNEIYFKDESAFWERPMRAEAALSQNSDVKIDVSTPHGNGNLFYRKRHGGKIRVFIFDWKDDPRKDRAWYDEQADKLDPIIVAQEIDRDYGASQEGVVIPAKWVKAAVGFPLVASGLRRAGLDVADEGMDKNAFVGAHGNVVELVTSWKTGNTTQTARRAARICRDSHYPLLRFDKIGVGAGVKGELADEGYEDIKVVPVATSESPTVGLYAPNRKNSDMFRNLRAQLWWLMRRRFQCTYEHVEGIKEHHPDDMISLPDDPELISELSQPTYSLGDSGKVVIEGKEHMKSVRGIPSPNKADALLLCFAPLRTKHFGSWRPDEDQKKPSRREVEEGAPDTSIHEAENGRVFNRSMRVGAIRKSGDHSVPRWKRKRLGVMGVGK